jgi:hypothetical protein
MLTALEAHVIMYFQPKSYQRESNLLKKLKLSGVGDSSRDKNRAAEGVIL